MADEDTSGAQAEAEVSVDKKDSSSKKSISDLKYKTEQLEREKAELANQVESANIKYSEAHQRALQHEVRVSSLEADLQKQTDAAKALAETQAKLDAATKEAGELRTAALGLKRNMLTTYGITLEQTEGKTITELDALEVAAKAIHSGKAGNYALAGGGGSPSLEGKSHRELARMAYEKQ